jgi:hypothetical protein
MVREHLRLLGQDQGCCGPGYGVAGSERKRHCAAPTVFRDKSRLSDALDAL